MLGELSKDMCDLQYVIEYFGGDWILRVGVFQCISPILLNIWTLKKR